MCFFISEKKIIKKIYIVYLYMYVFYVIWFFYEKSNKIIVRKYS